MSFDVTFAPVSNRATWVEMIDFPDEDGNAVEISAAEFNIGNGRIVKTLGSGIEYDDDTGRATITIDDSLMRGLCAGTYNVGFVVTISGEPTQILEGQVPVYDGNVT
jgi:hypothetical protein